MLSMVLESWNVSPTDNRAVHCTLANTLSLSEKYSQTVSVCRMASGTGCTGVHSDVTRFCAAGYSLAVLFSHSAVSNSLQPHGLQDPRLPVLHCLPKLAQIHDYGVSDAI